MTDAYQINRHYFSIYNSQKHFSREVIMIVLINMSDIAEHREKKPPCELNIHHRGGPLPTTN